MIYLNGAMACQPCLSGGDLGGVHLRLGRVPGQLQADLVETAVPGRISWTYHGNIPGLLNVSITNWKITMLLMGKSTISMGHGFNSKL